MEKEIKKVPVLCMEFVNQDGNQEKILSGCPVRPESVMHALEFLKPNCSITLSMVEGEFDENGVMLNNPLVESII